MGSVWRLGTSGGNCGQDRARDIRSSRGIQQDVAVLEVLRFGPVLKMLLQAVAALVATDWGDGRLVDNNSTVFSCHVG
jgi:hypothetical protein